MDEKELEILIPSEYVRNCIKETGWNFKDREKAALLYHADISWREQCKYLKNLEGYTADKELKKQICQYLDKIEISYAAFKENSDRSYIYILKVREEDISYSKIQPSGYFYDWEMACEYGKKEKVSFVVEKHLVGDKKNFQKYKDGEYCDYETAYLCFDEKGEEQYFGSQEMEIDKEDDFYESFKTAFYEVPNPFERGDIVRLVGTEEYGIVEVTQKSWKEKMIKFQSSGCSQKVDYSDVQIRVVFLNQDGTFSHDHINPITLERYQPRQENRKRADSARDDLLQAASAMYRNDDSTAVLASLDDLYYFIMKYRRDNGSD